MEGNGQVLMPPVGQEGEKTRVLYGVGLETLFRLQVAGALIFSPLWLCFFPRYMFFSEMSETSRSSAAPRGAGRPRPVAPARCRWGLFGGTVLAYSSCPPLALDARWPHGVECPWDIPPVRHLRRLLSLGQGLLDSRLPRRGQEEVGIWGRVPQGIGRRRAIFGAENAYVSVTRASSESRCWRAGRSRRCPAASRKERNGFLQCECNYLAGV